MDALSRKRVLFISYDGMSDPLGQSQVIPYLQGLVKAGYGISLLSCEKPEAYQQKKTTIAALLQQSNIQWYPIKYTKRPPVLSTVYDVFKLKRKARQIYKQQPFAMVHTRVGIPSMVGLWLKKKYGVKFLNDIREFYADSRVDGGMWNRSSFVYNAIYNYFKKQEHQEFINSDGLVCLTHAAQKIISTWPGYNAAIPLHVIPCSADLDLFNINSVVKSRREQYAQQWEIAPGDMVISYLGSIGGWYLTKEMLECCRAISQKIPSAKFLFISPHRHEQILEYAHQFGIPSQKIITVKADRKEVPLFLSLSKFSIFFIKPCYSKQSSSPTKHGEIMAMGIPVITNSGVGDVAQIVRSCDGGLVLNSFSQEAYDEVAASLETFPAKAQKIREAAQQIYSLDNAVQSYIALYKKILGC